MEFARAKLIGLLKLLNLYSVVKIFIVFYINCSNSKTDFLLEKSHGK